MFSIEEALGVVMRVPGLFIIDFWYRHDLHKSFPHSMEAGAIFNCVVTNLILLHGFLLLLLPLRHVRLLYTHFVSGAILFSCHTLSNYFIGLVTSEAPDNIVLVNDPIFVKAQLAMLVFHSFLGALISVLLDGPWERFTPVFAVYSLPLVARALSLPPSLLPSVQNFGDAIVAFNVVLYISYKIPCFLECAKEAYMDALIVTEAHGLGTLCTLLWNKLFVPTHFALFWLIEFCVKLAGGYYKSEAALASWGDEWYLVLLTTVSSICASPVTLVATSVSVSYLSFFLLYCTRCYLAFSVRPVPASPTHSGWTEGLTLVLLSFQTGLVELRMPQRTAVMTIILFIVLSSLLQSVLEIAEPVVLALSASRSRSLWRHFRALSLCFALLVFPLYLTRVLSAVFPIDFWMMVVLSSCTLTSVQVLDLLVVHALFVYDSVRGGEPWERLDDVVYCTRAVTKVLEFCVAIFVVAMGLWESTAGKWNWVNASILLVHCYFNVWQRLQTGWRSFLLRRDAATKARALPAATPEQLAALDDVCSICFGAMAHAGACVTPCRHFFHRTCLRKWLYVQDKCPLCHGLVEVQTLPAVVPSHAHAD